MTEHCKICGEDHQVVLEEHHIIPRRFDGPDRGVNMVTLCANCHRAIESMYDKSFWDRVGQYVNYNYYIDPEDAETDLMAVYFHRVINAVIDQHPGDTPTNRCLGVSNDQKLDWIPRTRREAMAFEAGMLNGHQTILTEIGSVYSEIPVDCAECGSAIEIPKNTIQMDTPDDIPESAGRFFLCHDCNQF